MYSTDPANTFRGAFDSRAGDSDGAQNARNRSSSPTAPTNASVTSATGAIGGRRLRGACDFCTKRRRRCDGDGVNPCSLCKAKKQPSCHYSVRLPTGPRRNANAAGSAANPKRAANGWASSSPATAGAGAIVVAGGQGELARTVSPPAAATQQSTAMTVGGVGGGSAVSLKRARLSPSPATGLVGMRENDHIADYFRAMGFLPIADESIIRKALISTMFAAVQKQFGGEGFGEEDSGVFRGGWGDDGAIVAASRTGGGSASDEQAVTCTLWSTVALGALVQGRPTESVAEYLQLARGALAGCFDSETAETARAYTAMALLNNFIGDEAKFTKYTMFARNILEALPAHEVPQDLSDSLLFIDACDMFRFDGLHATYTGPLSKFNETSWCEWTPSTSLKAPRILRRSDMCRYMLQTDVRLGRSFFADMEECGVFDSGEGNLTSPVSPLSSSPATATSLTDILRLHANAPRYADEDDCNKEKDLCDDTGGWKQAGTGFMQEPPPPGKNSLKFAEETRKEFELLEKAAESPEVKEGVGGLYFNSITAYLHVLQGGIDVAFEKMLRCADVIERNPGLLRFTAWSHLGHCVLAVLAATCSCLKYERVRTAYNSIIDDPTVPRAPPIEEWEGMKDICDAVFCRSLYCQLGKAAVEGDSESEANSTAPSAMHGTTTSKGVPSRTDTPSPPGDAQATVPALHLDESQDSSVSGSQGRLNDNVTPGFADLGGVVQQGQEPTVNMGNTKNNGKVVGAGNWRMWGTGGQPESFSSFGTASTETYLGSQNDDGERTNSSQTNGSTVQSNNGQDTVGSGDAGGTNATGTNFSRNLGVFTGDFDGPVSQTQHSIGNGGGNGNAQAVAEPSRGPEADNGKQDADCSETGSLLDALMEDGEFLEGFEGAFGGEDDGNMSPLNLDFTNPL